MRIVQNFVLNSYKENRIKQPTILAKLPTMPTTNETGYSLTIYKSNLSFCASICRVTTICPANVGSLKWDSYRTYTTMNNLHLFHLFVRFFFPLSILLFFFFTLSFLLPYYILLLSSCIIFLS